MAGGADGGFMEHSDDDGPGDMDSFSPIPYGSFMLETVPDADDMGSQVELSAGSPTKACPLHFHNDFADMHDHAFLDF